VGATIARVSTAAALLTRSCSRCGSTYGADALFCAKDGTKLAPEDTDLNPDADPYIGMVISGDIELRSVAGTGAMGRVYRAHQRGIDRDVAVKILHREMSGNTQLVQRFHREAKIASKLQHPHVVEVYLAGQLPDRALYIVMEYLDGLSLAASLMATGGAFTPSRALSIALQICDAVGEGHSRGIVHRDLKPENVMLVRRAEMVDWVKVLDFGIAKVAVGEQSMQTAAGLVFGTARYISPEGAQGANVAPSGDVYSLATMIYQMLAGRTPFDAEPVGLLIKHIHEPPPPITSFPRAADLHPALVKVIMDNLAKEPAKRAQNARLFAAQIAQAAKDASISISEVGVVARLSNVDFGRASVALDPTMDDASPQLGVARSDPPRASTELAMPVAPVAADAAAVAAVAAPAASAVRSGDRRRGVAIVALAFLLGAALAVIGTQHFATHAGDDRTAHLSRARRALTESRYVNPPGDNVSDIVNAGLAKWPDDTELAQVRADAAHEMVTRSMAARAGGDLGGARDLVRDALQLDPADHTARILVGQYQDEVDSMLNGTTTNTGGPKVIFEVPALARPGQKLDLTARIAPGAAGAKAKVHGGKVTLFDNGKTSAGTSVAIAASETHDFKGTLTAPKVGSYDVVFEATVDGTIVRASRDLDVVR
jgi:serine/threonine protein kinase